MTKKVVRLEHLKLLGFNLSKAEATELLPLISRVSQHGADDNEVYEGTDPQYEFVDDDEDDEDFSIDHSAAEAEKRIEYIGYEGFELNEETGNYIDENGAIVTAELVHSEISFDDFAAKVVVLMAAAAPVDPNEDNLPTTVGANDVVGDTEEPAIANESANTAIKEDAGQPSTIAADPVEPAKKETAAQKKAREKGEASPAGGDSFFNA